jgi:hypothetical protein
MTAKGRSKSDSWASGWLGSLTIALAGVMGLAGGLTAILPAPTETPGSDTLPADLEGMPSDAAGFLSVRLGDLWHSEWAKEARQRLPKETRDIEEDFAKAFGLNLQEVERFTLVFREVSSREPLLFIFTTRPYDRARVLAALGGNVKEEKVKGQTVYSGRTGEAVHLIAPQALVFGPIENVLAQLESSTPKNGNLRAGLRQAAGGHLLTVGVNVSAVAEVVTNELPPEDDAIKPLLKASFAMATFDLGKGMRGDLEVHFAKEAEAEEAHKGSPGALTVARNLLNKYLEEMDPDKTIDQIAYLVKRFQDGLQEAPIGQKGTTLQARLRIPVDPSQLNRASLQVMKTVREASLRAKSGKNLMAIGSAMHQYAARFGRTPPHAVYSKDGKPLLSWRVLLLPHLEDSDVFRELHLDEPWDSEHNKKLLPRMPKVYASPADPTSLKTYQTHYLGFVGKGAFFDGKQGLRFPADFPDGTSNTIFVVEATKSVPWTKPEDLPFDPAKPIVPIGGLYGSGFSAGLCDGSAHFFRKSISARTLKNAITRNDGEVLGPDF